MENIIDNLEALIDDIERDNTLTKTDITEALYKIKEEIEQYNLNNEENDHSISWDDLDY